MEHAVETQAISAASSATTSASKITAITTRFLCTDSYRTTITIATRRLMTVTMVMMVAATGLVMTVVVMVAAYRYMNRDSYWHGNCMCMMMVGIFAHNSL